MRCHATIAVRRPLTAYLADKRQQTSVILFAVACSPDRATALQPLIQIRTRHPERFGYSDEGVSSGGSNGMRDINFFACAI